MRLLSNSNYYYLIGVVCFWLFLALFLFMPKQTMAAEYSFSKYERYADSVQVENLDTLHQYYGELNNFPQNYLLSVATNTEVTVSLQAFTEVDPVTLGVIIVRQNPRGSVTEITRLRSADADWEIKSDFISDEEYRQGPSYTGVLEKGNYLIEVSSPRNTGQYSLIVKNAAVTDRHNLFAQFSRVYQLKLFLGRNPLSVLFTPIYYLPLGFFIILGFGYVHFYRRS